MKIAIINLGGEDYSVQYKNNNDIYSVQDLNGKEIEFNIDENFYIDVIDKITIKQENGCQGCKFEHRTDRDVLCPICKDYEYNIL